MADGRTCVGRWTYVRWAMDVRALANGRTCVGRWTYVHWAMDVRALGYGRIQKQGRLSVLVGLSPLLHSDILI